MVNSPLEKQTDDLIKILLKNSNVSRILKGKPFPSKTCWYLGAGCVCQTVWNYLFKKQPTYGINDYDLVYYGASDLSKESESLEQERINKLYGDLGIRIEVVNEARVHLWFEEDFGKKIDQFKSCEDAINNWPTTATAIGVNMVRGKMNVYTPYGLNDLFGMIVRPNKPSVIKWVYEKKVEKWTKKWPDLKVIPWEQV